MPDLPAPTWMLDEQGVVRMASADAARLLGCEPADLEGRLLGDLLEAPSPSVIAAILNELAAPCRLAVRVPRADGEAAEADLWLTPLPAGSGEGRLAVATLRWV